MTGPRPHRTDLKQAKAPQNQNPKPNAKRNGYPFIEAKVSEIDEIECFRNRTEKKKSRGREMKINKIMINVS